MAGLKLDGAGQVKMATLEEAMQMVTQLHGHVERMAVAMKSPNANTNLYVQAVRRVGQPLAAKLKGQFGMISDIVTGMLLASTRGGGDVTKLRALREGVAQTRVQLEIAMAQVKEKHARKDEKPEAAGS